MIYFDNSASTWIKPKSVQKAVLNGLTIFTANPGRSGHKMATKTGMEVESVRMKLAEHVHTSPDKVIFTLNCTDALNLAIFGTQKDGHVVCTENEHNSVLRPLEHLRQTRENFSFSVAQSSGKSGIVWQDIEKCLQPNTYLVIVNHISNVNGDVADIEEIGTQLAKRNILFLVDGAQGGGHFEYDMQRMNINMITFAPHKAFYSPQGVGALCVCGDVPLMPTRFGGTGTSSFDLSQPTSFPEGFESGTLNTPAILGFGAGLDFVKENFTQIQSKLEDLTTYLHYEFSKLPVEIYTKTENTNGVFAFNIPGLTSANVANYLNDKWAICVRSGLHCAPLKHKALGTAETGAVRVSLSYFNTYQEVEHFVYAIRSLIKIKQSKI